MTDVSRGAGQDLPFQLLQLRLQDADPLNAVRREFQPWINRLRWGEDDAKLLVEKIELGDDQRGHREDIARG